MKALARFLAAALVLLLVMVPITAFAAEDTLQGADESHDIDVEAKYVDGTTTPDVYSIDVTWGAMQFTYTTSGTKEWDPASHEYTGNFSGAWTASGNTVTVTNHSNKAVNVTFSYAKAAGFDRLNGTLSVTSHTLSAGVVGDVQGADSISTALTLSGTLTSDVAEFTKVGSVTVSLQ